MKSRREAKAAKEALPIWQRRLLLQLIRRRFVRRIMPRVRRHRTPRAPSPRYRPTAIHRPETRASGHISAACFLKLWRRR
ncbi:hypothetical protein IEQ34_019519 [Dendrobium chrysotoxum]|uniref:Uncharacterized protein n=1 Tax=Dendrobium chrysotoxum TaxID=161865 RepID=A0AAV7FRH3_DENCH|nr:hypothetical protein IEQ34_019519 [Dendrobium chrysotoxum]